MKRRGIVLALSVFLLLTGCIDVKIPSSAIKGSGVMSSEERNLDAFESIHASGYSEIEITCQQTQKVVLRGDDNLLKHVKTEVRDGELRIYHVEQISHKKPLTITISIPTVERIEASGANSIVVKDVRNEDLHLTISGSANIKASGTTDNLKARLSGAGNLDTKDLPSKTADVIISGAGNADVYVSEKLEARVSGVGNISYYGSPEEVVRRVSGVGSINEGDI